MRKLRQTRDLERLLDLYDKRIEALEKEVEALKAKKKKKFPQELIFAVLGIILLVLVAVFHH